MLSILRSIFSIQFQFESGLHLRDYAYCCLLIIDSDIIEIHLIVSFESRILLIVTACTLGVSKVFVVKF